MSSNKGHTESNGFKKGNADLTALEICCLKEKMSIIAIKRSTSLKKTGFGEILTKPNCNHRLWNLFIAWGEPMIRNSDVLFL